MPFTKQSMKISAVCLPLAFCFSGAAAFIGAGSSASSELVFRCTMHASSSISHARNTWLKAQKKVERPGLDECDATRSIFHPAGCPSLFSSRAARIEIPIKVLFVSTALAGAALADEITADKPASPSTSTESIPDQEQPLPSELPRPRSFDDSLQCYFPKALPTSAVALKVQTALSQRKYTRGNTLFGTCISPDEINSKPVKSLSSALQHAITDNGVFMLGGLAGLPYMGASGMKSFLSHTPSNGKVFIMYGPNIGITESGSVGYVERLGKTSPTQDCDITMNALRVAQSLRANTAISKKEGPVSAETAVTKKLKGGNLDKREEYIVAKLRKMLDTKEGSSLAKDDLPAFATFQMFNLVKEQLMRQLEACLKDDANGGNVAWDENIDEIVLLGGIIVNRGQRAGSIEPREDYFEPLVFESYSSPGNFGELAGATDLFQPLFGAKPIPFYAS